MSKRATRSKAKVSDSFDESYKDFRGSKKSKILAETKISNIIDSDTPPTNDSSEKSHTVALPSENVEKATAGMDESKTKEDSGSEKCPSDGTSDEKSESHEILPYNGANTTTERTVQQKIQMLEYRRDDPWSPYQINNRVRMVLEKWGNLAPMRPDIFLFKLLESRGYDPSVIPARDYRK
jgi:hypothetical protein